MDFTSTEDPRKAKGDYFVLLVGRIIPGNRGMIIENGVRARVSQAEAEGIVAAWCARYPTLQLVGVEAIIQGQMFYNQLLMNAELKSNGVVLKPVKFNTRKGYRFEKILAPLFQRSRIMLADNAEIEVLHHFRTEWISWQGDALEDMYHNDTLDAAYALSVAADYAIAPIAEHETSINNPLYKQANGGNPYVAAWSNK